MTGVAHTDYEIRAARESELSELAAIERAAADLFRTTPYADLVGDTLGLDFLRTRHEAGTVWVAALGRPVGFAVGNVVAGAAFLAEVDVDPAHGHRGLGRALVERVCDWARRDGYTDLVLSTFADVDWNAPFYARAGFRLLGRHEYAATQTAVREAEFAQGLPIERRVLMARYVGSAQLAVAPKRTRRRQSDTSTAVAR